MQTATPLSRWALALYCLAVGFSVAAVVYHQSMTQMIAASFGLPSGALWGLSVATQSGYGAGLIFGLPLGDSLSPRRLIPAVMSGLGGVLMLLAVAPSLPVMIVFGVLAGLLSIGGQLVIAYCARTCSAAERPAVIGSLLSSLFAGLLLARVLAGWGSVQIGWRGVYMTVGALTVLLGLAMRRAIRALPPAASVGYVRMLGQQAQRWLDHAELRRYALIAACFFAASNGIWANLGSLTFATLHWSAGQTGLLAFTSLFALRSPKLAMWMQQRMRWQNAVILLGMAMALVSLLGMVEGASLPMIIAFLIFTDIGVRSVQALTQSRVLDIDPPAASRLNSLYMTVFFFGAAIGSWLGGVTIHHLGWAGMYLFPLLCAGAGIALLHLPGSAAKLAKV
ncbi:MFS transporter [Chitinimonas sp.]|uniref:MFS transporter n=1 Tax=Chitinimonas sp. TaxID=1934313 RepID=UPI0035B32820